MASSDATNIRCEIRRDGDGCVINGRRWYPSDTMNATCQLLIVLGKSDSDHADPQLRQPMILRPKNTPGGCIVLDIQVRTLSWPPEFDTKCRFPAPNRLFIPIKSTG